MINQIESVTTCYWFHIIFTHSTYINSIWNQILVNPTILMFTKHVLILDLCNINHVPYLQQMSGLNIDIYIIVKFKFLKTVRSCYRLPTHSAWSCICTWWTKVTFNNIQPWIVHLICCIYRQVCFRYLVVAEVVSHFLVFDMTYQTHLRITGLLHLTFIFSHE